MQSRAFSIIEVMVTISIIGILSAIVYANFGANRAVARDAERQADLLRLDTAINMYKQRYGRYPEQGTVDGANGFSTEASGEYIKGLAPEFIPKLPRDPRLNGKKGFAYKTNPGGTVYKVMVSGTVEAETVTPLHKLKPCDIMETTESDTNVGPKGGWCSNLNTDTDDGIRYALWCTVSNDTFKTSYARWGGYEFTGGNDGLALLADEERVPQRRNIVRPTTKIICAAP